MSGRKADLQRLFAALARVKLANMAEKPNGASQDEMGRDVGMVDRIWLDTMEETRELRESANFFTGTYFSDVRSKSMNLKHWPHRPAL